MGKIMFFYCDIQDNPVIRNQITDTSDDSNFEGVKYYCFKQFNFFKNKGTYKEEFKKNMDADQSISKLAGEVGICKVEMANLYLDKCSSAPFPFTFSDISGLIKPNEVEEKDNLLSFIYKNRDGNIFLTQQLGEGFQKENAPIVFSCMLKYLVDKKINIEDSQFYFICHGKHIGKGHRILDIFNREEVDRFKDNVINCIEKWPNNNDIKNKLIIENIISFQHESGCIIYDDILLKISDIKPNVIFNIIENLQLKKKILEKYNVIISFLHPFFIDIQGFNKIEDSARKEQYKKELKNGVNISYIKLKVDKLIKDVNEILKKEDIKTKLTQLQFLLDNAEPFKKKFCLNSLPKQFTDLIQEIDNKKFDKKLTQ